MKHSEAENMQARSAGKHAARHVSADATREAAGRHSAAKEVSDKPRPEHSAASRNSAGKHSPSKARAARKPHAKQSNASPKKSTAKKRASSPRNRRSRKRSILRSRFYQVYFLLVILCVLGIALGARYLNGVLEDYESAQPKYVAQQAARLFERGDYEAIFGLDTSMRDVSEEDRAYYIGQLEALAAGREVSWSEAYSGNEDERRYRVSLDGEKFAEFTLVPSGAQTKRGSRLWTLGSVTTFVRIEEPQIAEPEPTPVPTIACSITVPSSFTVTADGRTLDANDVVEDGIPIVPSGMLPSDVTAPAMVRYAFPSESGAPDIRVTDWQGNAQTPVQDGEYSWRCELPQNPELEALYGESALEVAKRIAKYSTREASQDSVLKKCAKGSPAYESIKSFDSSLGKKPKSSTFENVVVSDFYLYSEDCFSCRVSFDYIPRFSSGSKTYPTAYTLYFVRQEDTGKLYSFSLG